MTSSLQLERTVVSHDGTRLACRDWGGGGVGGNGDGSKADVLLLHGLAGHSGEWDAIARLLRGAGHRVVAFDQRGQGSSERLPGDATRAAHVADVVSVVRELGLRKPLLIGQSLGGHTAFLAASAHPGLVRALVLVEAGPGGSAPDAPEKTGRWLRDWPVPFPSREAAVAYLGGGKRPVGEGWADGLEERDGGLWPRFDPDVMVRSLDENARRAFWDEWTAITCPVLVVLGQGEHGGLIGGEEYAEMARLRPELRGASLPGTGHDLHLEQPEELHRMTVEFLASLEPDGPR